nr:arylesterase [Alteromonas aestuariivivens]
MVLGDSLSAGYGLEQQQGWVSLLQNLWYNEGIQIDVINAAISGETSDGALARLPRLLEQHRPSHVLIELGGNDGLQGHPVTKLKSNLIQIVNLAQAAGAEVFLQDMQIPTNYGRRYTQMFADAYDEVARVQNVPLLPFFLESVALNPELMQNDGIHPNAQAQPQIAEFMRQQLTPLIVE